MTIHRPIQAALALLILTCTAPPAQAALHHSDRDEVLSVNLLDALGGVINVGYENALSDFVSLHIGLDFLAFEGPLAHYDGTVFAAGPSFGLNLYLIGDAPAGLFIGPYVAGSWVHAKSGQETRDYFGWALGGRLGVGILLSNLHLGLGIGGLFRDYAVRLNDQDVGPRGFAPRFEFTVGVAF